MELGSLLHRFRKSAEPTSYDLETPKFADKPQCRPRWLVSKGKDEEALQALGKLRGLATSDPRIQHEWFDIRAEVTFHKETSALRHPNIGDQDLISRIKLEVALWTDCFRRGCWRRTHVGVGLMFFQQVSSWRNVSLI